MGAEESSTPNVSSRPYESEVYVPIGEPRLNNERQDAVFGGSNSLRSLDKHQNLFKSAFSGIWTVKLPNSIAPVPRTGHFYCYDDETHRCFIGYGIDASNTPIDDFWILDTLSHKWRMVRLSGEVLPGRSGARALYENGKLLVYGGFANSVYLGDLHTIDVETGVVKTIVTTGDVPAPRASPVFVKFGENVYLWGGFNGEWPTDLHVLNLQTMNWTVYPQDIAGRITVPGVVYKDKYYAYGGSKSGGMLVLDFKSNSIYLVQTTGSDPPSGVIGSGIALVERYMFFFGGKAASDWTLMYACDIEKMWWFVFHVMPDGDTVSIADGAVSELGLFMLPRIHSFGVCYVKKNREIMAFLGSPIKDPPPLFIVNIGEAMSIIHLREDMIDMINNSN